MANYSGETRVPGTDLRMRLAFVGRNVHGEVIRSVQEQWGREGEPFNLPRMVTVDRIVASTTVMHEAQWERCAKTLRELGAKTAGQQHATFVSWNCVLAHAASGAPLFYHAPLDVAPVRVTVLRAYKNGKVRVSTGDTRFTADSGHLDRFRYALESEPARFMREHISFVTVR